MDEIVFKEHSSDFTVKETHLDVFGHMNNATYLELYEEARWDIIVNKGFDIEYIKKSKTGPVILEINLKFMSELLPREKIKIITTVEKYKGLVGVIKQQMVKSNGTIASEAFFTFGLFDLEKRKLIKPTKEWLDTFC